MAALEWKDLTQEQVETINAWWAANDPDGTIFEYADNFRYALKDNVEQGIAYDAIQSGGCCGFHDVELPLSDGTTLLYGFNYGH